MAGIWPASLYQASVKCLTTSEQSVYRKARVRTGRFHLEYQGEICLSGLFCLYGGEVCRQMRELEQYIRERGIVLSDSVVKVNSFLNHLVDPVLITHLGRHIANRFQSDSVTKVLTIEASGIHIAYAVAYCLGVPFVYAKKSKAVTQSDVYEAAVYSFTRKQTYPITVSKEFLTSDDRILIVDDILAEGAGVRGLLEILAQAGSTLIGVSVAIEKSFQNGRRWLDEAGIPVYALARIAKMSPEAGIEFIPDEEEHHAH